MSVRTRIAPSPTGEYHVGGLRTLLFDYALAKKNNGQLIIRIEDTDQGRLVPGAVERLLDVIEEYGISWDEGPRIGGPHAPYVQSERLDLYKKYALELVEKGHAYYCFCTEERLNNLREEQRSLGMPTTKYDKHCLGLSKEEISQNLSQNKSYVIRLNVPKDRIIEVDDLVLGKLTFPSNDLDDQVLLKSDGFPTYQLAVVVDDHLMEITHVIRGFEWLPSTPKHILLYEAFGWAVPNHAHVPLLKEAGSTKKLSKRMGSVAAADFLKEGYLPEAVLNFLMFLGWNPGTEKEIYNLKEFVDDFSIDRIQKTDLVTFDRQKLLWYNGYYIRAYSAEDLTTKIIDYHKKYYPDALFINWSDPLYTQQVVRLLQERLKLLSEFQFLSSYFYSKPEIDKKLLIEFSGSVERSREILNAFLTCYDGIEKSGWDLSAIDNLSHELVKEKGFKPKEAFMTLRVALTGQTTTPPIFDISALLGKDAVIDRIKDSLNEL